jgi:glutaryl-CoA dehydrogenase
VKDQKEETTVPEPSVERKGHMPPAGDLYQIDHFLSDEERQVRDRVRTFFQQRVLPIVGKHFAAETFPQELLPELAEHGLLGMQIKGYGCAGRSAVWRGLAFQELDAGDCSLRTFVSVQGSLAMFAIAQFGAEEQKQRWLSRMARGEVIGCFALSEPDIGSDPGSMETSARRDGASYILNGTKQWITNGGIADLAVVWARAEDSIRGFLVEHGTPGFTTSDIQQKLSLRTSVPSKLHWIMPKPASSYIHANSHGRKMAGLSRFGVEDEGERLTIVLIPVLERTERL